MLVFDTPSAVDFANVISASGLVVIEGAATVNLTAADTCNADVQDGTLEVAGQITGTVTIGPQGTLQLGNGNNGTIAGNVVDNGTLAFDIVPATLSYVFADVISGSGSVVVDGTGTVELTAANTYTGNTDVRAGILNIQNDSALGTVAGGVTVKNGATLQLEGGIAVAATGTLILFGTGVVVAGAGIGAWITSRVTISGPVRLIWTVPATKSIATPIPWR